MAARMEQKLVLVTGGSAGIGLAVAEHLLGLGAVLVLMDVNPTAGRAAAEELSRRHGPGRCHFVQADVSDTAQLARAFEEGKRAAGRPHYDAVVLNAGIGEDPRHLWDPSPAGVEGWKRVVAVDFTAVLDGMRLAVADLVRGGSGSVVAVASMAGILPTAHPVYAAAKAGVVHLGRSLVPPTDRVRVNVICPSFTDTKLVAGIMEKDPEFAQVVRSVGGTIPPALVAEGVARLLTDETKRNQVMRVTRQNGIDYQPYPKMPAPQRARL